MSKLLLFLVLFLTSLVAQSYERGIVLPASCHTGDLFFLIGATTGQNLYQCVAARWSLVGATNFSQLAGSVAHAQIAQNSATTGQVLAWSGTVWAPADPAAGVSGVSSFNSRTGAVSPASNDYNFNQLAGTISTTQMPQSSGSVSGYLSSTDWTTFNSKVGTARSVATDGTTLTGGGDLSADRTLSVVTGGVGTNQLAANAVTSAKVDAELIQRVTVSMTSANIKALHATPLQLIAAPGAGKQLIIHRVVIDYTWNTATYSSPGTGTTKFHLSDNGSATMMLLNSFSNAGTNPFLCSNSCMSFYTGIVAGDNASAGNALVYGDGSYSPGNLALYVYNTAATEFGASSATAAGTAKVHVWYSIVTL